MHFTLGTQLPNILINQHKFEKVKATYLRGNQGNSKIEGGAALWASILLKTYFHCFSNFLDFPQIRGLTFLKLIFWLINICVSIFYT